MKATKSFLSRNLPPAVGLLMLFVLESISLPWKVGLDLPDAVGSNLGCVSVILRGKRVRPPQLTSIQDNYTYFCTFFSHSLPKSLNSFPLSNLFSTFRISLPSPLSLSFTSPSPPLNSGDLHPLRQALRQQPSLSSVCLLL